MLSDRDTPKGDYAKSVDRAKQEFKVSERGHILFVRDGLGDTFGMSAKKYKPLPYFHIDLIASVMLSMNVGGQPLRSSAKPNLLQAM